MKRFVVSIVIAIAIICGYLTLAYAGGSPTTTTPAPQTSEMHKLANTWYSAFIAGAFTNLLVLFGAGIYSVSRKDD